MAMNPREEIQRKIEEEDLRWLLLKAGELHGHFCPFVALGVKASVIAVKRMKAFTEGIDEDILAIVETNNCFSDGVQMTTGCTFGNNALIFKDVGKTAMTLALRGGRGVRVAVKAEYPKKMSDVIPGAREMFDRFILRRETGTPEEMKQFKETWEALSFKQLEIPIEDQFTVQEVSVALPGRAPIFPSVVCSECGDSFMEPRGRLRNGNPICLPCSGDTYYVLEGEGIRAEKGKRQGTEKN